MCGVATCERPAIKRSFCQGHYRRWQRGDVRPAEPLRAYLDLPTAFWRKVAKAGPDECWLWTGGVRTTGYGQIRYLGRNHAAHRVSYEINVGPIPEGLHIDHLCRVRLCVNPIHLEPVTQDENNRRMRAALATMNRGI
jgi:hypothetical protein